MKIAVIGHIEWCRFVKVDHLPAPGEIIRSVESWEEAAGGGSVAAVQLAKLAGSCLFFTAVGNDQNGKDAIKQLTELGVEVHASVINDVPTKEAFVHIDKNKERAITVIGNLAPSGNDKSLPWEKLAEMDAVYFVSGDKAALTAARRAKQLIATARVLPVLKEGSIKLDALVMSQKDNNERYDSDDLSLEPSLVVMTDGTEGGSTLNGETYKAESINGEDFRDTYGCGDSFAAGLTFALAQGLSVTETLKLAAHVGAQAAQRYGAHGVTV